MDRKPMDKNQRTALFLLLEKTDRDLEKVRGELRQKEKSVLSMVEQMGKKQVVSALQQTPIAKLSLYDDALPIPSLQKAGLTDVGKVYSMGVTRLQRTLSCPMPQAEKIQSAAAACYEEEMKKFSIRFSPMQPTGPESMLLRALSPLVQCAQIQRDLEDLQGEHHAVLTETLGALRRGYQPLRRLFSSKVEKEKAEDQLFSLYDLAKGAYKKEADRILSAYLSSQRGVGDVWGDFSKNAAAYYAVLSRIRGESRSSPDSCLDPLLLESIQSHPLHLSLLKVSLRPYQTFGAQYILHQKKVLLGDEMGLGKTVQAIAAMASIAAEEDARFLVVCPAGVLINWCREIALHSSLAPIKLHGDCEAALEQWKKTKGVAVTTYDTLKKIPPEDTLHLAMMVADEAHYVKNPEARRTEVLLQWMEHSDRVLFMTGTPLENQVEEMCFLISSLQPEIAKNIPTKTNPAALLFKTAIAPVYLRRTREDVLQELPELTEKEEWCDMNPSETASYRQAVASGNFMAMRQVSWQVDEMTQSQKAQHLLEIISLAETEQRKVIVFSFFRSTIQKVCTMMGAKCLSPITGDVSPKQRQKIIDDFTAAPSGTVLVCQIQAGGTGLNIQTASVVVFCEPQIKPSLEHQAISRTYRMGQTRNVLVYRLLSDDTVDERILEILRTKQQAFDTYADESLVGEAYQETEEKQQAEARWITQIVSQEQQRLAVSKEASAPVEQNSAEA